MTSVPVSPNSSIRIRPATSVPTIAPRVFAAYSRPNAGRQVTVLVELAGERRERRAHEDRRRREREHREREPDQGQHDRLPLDRREDAAIDARGAAGT